MFPIRFVNRCFALMAAIVATAASAPLFDSADTMRTPEIQIHYPIGSPQIGREVRVFVRLDSGWHINADSTTDDFLIPTTLAISARGLEFGKPRWPKPIREYSSALQMDLLSFADTFSVYIPITRLDQEYDTLSTQVTLRYQACSHSICLAPAQIVATLGEGSGKNSPAKKNSSVEFASPTQAQQTSLGWLLLFAFIGGLILNLMPCVLPVLSIKALSLAKQAGSSRRTLFRLALSMTLGILVSFWILAAIVVLIQKAGGYAGWGFQFQNPAFLSFMALLMTAFALNLFGVFEIWLPGSATTTLDRADKRGGLVGSFLSGALMTLLATPCSAPFLGTAMGFAFSQPAKILVLFLSATGLGLAAPFLLLSLFPAALRLIPKPGMWMVRFKQFLGFLLLGTALWLVWIFGQSSGLAAMSALLALLLILSIALWGLGLWAVPGMPFWRVPFAWSLVIGVTASLWIFQISPLLGIAHRDPAHSDNATHSQTDGWYPWTPDIVPQLIAQGKTVFVDFTADWCLTCKTNEIAVLGQDTVKRAFEQFDVAKVRADWTRPNPEIAKALRSFGRSGVPLYVVYSYQDPENPLVLPEILTPSLVLDALLRAGPSRQ